MRTGWAILAVGLLAATAMGQERFVDPSAAAGGDGSPAHPFVHLSDALAAGAKVHLAAGEYPGSFTLPTGAVLEGSAGVRIVAAQGPALKIEAHAEVRGVGLEGNPVAVTVGASGRLTLAGAEVVGADTGIAIDGGELEASDVTVRGGSLGIDAQRAKVRLRRATLAGARAVRAVQGELRLEQVSVGPGPNTGVFVSGTRLEAHGLRIDGRRAEGLMSGNGAVVALDDLRVSGSGRVGLALVNSRGTVRSAQISASEGDGVQLIGSRLTLSGSRISGGTGCGLLINHGEVTLDDDVISGIHSSEESDGTGLMVRNASVVAIKLRIEDVSGTGVWVAQRGALRFGRITEHRVGQEALLVETFGATRGDRLEGQAVRGPVLRVTGPARLELDRLVVPPSDRGQLVARCENDAKIVVRHGLPPTPDVPCRSE